MDLDDLKHAQQERLLYIDRLFAWRGYANRRDLVERFGISTPQAALDFRTYLARFEGKAPYYDNVRKAYVVDRNHCPLAPTETLDAWEEFLPDFQEENFEELPVLARKSDPDILARLSRAMASSEAIEVKYTSMTTGDRSDQWLAPTRFASDGTRVHVRAFSFRHGEYRDYLPVRIDKSSSFKRKKLDEALPADADWHTWVRITLRPCRDLSREQAAAVREEFAFQGDLLTIETRKALEFYADRRWGLDQPGARLERVKTEYFEDPGNSDEQKKKKKTSE